MGSWADLPPDIMSLVICRLSNFDDVVVFSSVCKSWQLGIAAIRTKPPLPPKFPWLMLAEEGNERGTRRQDEAIQTRGFFSLLDHKTYKFDLPEAVNSRCFGASFGWLLTFGIDLQISLLHPFSRLRFSLPPQSAFCRLAEKGLTPEDVRNFFVGKVVLSQNPYKSRTCHYDPDCIVMAICGGISVLAFARIGDKAWIDIPSTSHAFRDIVYFKEKFYVVDFHGVTFICDIDDDQNPKATAIAPPPAAVRDRVRKYLVESEGQLLLVLRFYGGRYFVTPNCGFYASTDDSDGEDDSDEISIAASTDDSEGEDDSDDANYDEEDDADSGTEGGNFDGEQSEVDSEDENNDDMPYITIGFVVMKLVENTEGGSRYKYKWEKVGDLGDQALFVGYSSSVSVSASSSPGCKANCIYFTDDQLYLFGSHQAIGGHDMGIFSLDDATIKHHYTGQSFSFFSSPVWYM